MLSRASKAREELLSALSHSAVPAVLLPLSVSAHMCHPPKETNRNGWSQCGTSVLQVDSDLEDFFCIIMGYTHTQGASVGVEGTCSLAGTEPLSSTELRLARC